MGTRALFEACCHPFHNELPRGERGGRPRLSFEGFNMDNDSAQGLLDLVAPAGKPRNAQRPRSSVSPPVPTAAPTRSAPRPSLQAALMD